METINQYLYFSIFNNLIKDYILMGALSLVIFFGLVLLKRILLKRVIHILNDNFAEFKSLVMDLISGISTYLLIALSIYFPLKNLEINYTLLRYIDYIFLFILIYEIIHITNKTLEYILSKKILKGNYGNQELTTYNMFKISGKVIVWVVGLLLFLSNIGFQIGPLLASLGVGGVVLAFALQNILEDIFSSFTIYLDQPFHIGDFVTIGTDKGTVIKIGIKSTRIRTPEGQELVVSNRELTGARIQNFGKMTKRRIEITFGIKYETPIEKTKKINDTIKNIFNEIEGTEFIDSKFFLLGAYSLDFKVYYYITNGDYFDYLDKQEKFNFKLMEEFQKQGIEFAYPTQVLYVNKQN